MGRWSGNMYIPSKVSAVIPFDLREKARLAAFKAKKRGVITPKPCAVCDAVKVEMHHFDYTRPLEIIWLCRAHHRAIHKSMHQHIPSQKA